MLLKNFTLKIKLKFSHLTQKTMIFLSCLVIMLTDDID